MHVVTKILVVCCAILSLLLAALTMAYASNAQAIVGTYRDSDTRRVAAELSAKLEVLQAAERHDKDQKALAALQNEQSAKEQSLSNLQAERSRLIAELEQSKAEVAAIRNQTQQFTATIDTQVNLIKQYSSEVTGLRDELLASSKKEIELIDRINDLESAREVLEQNSRALKEQLEETHLSLQNAQLGASTGGTAGSAASQGGVALARELPGPIVRARIAEIFNTPTGDMVVISEGANRGIRENSLMHVIRGGQFVGSVVITSVEPTRSAGRISLLNGGEKVQKDDMVLSRLQ